jgi:beta-lactamase class A
MQPISWRKFFNRQSVTGIIIGALVAGVVVYALYPQQSQQQKALRESDVASSTGYEFTDPLLTVTSGGANSTEYSQLQSQIQTYINSQERGALSSASVRFADIESQEGFTINPDEQYDPASLTKIPLAMAYYSLAESDPSVLSQTIHYSGTPDLDADEQVESPTQLTPGKPYTVEEMIEHMIKYSDNNAEQLLADHLSQIGQLEVLSTLFDDLGVKNDTSNPDDTTVGSYSLFLRVLFNATYLDRDYSEKLLQLLSQSDFTQGISAGVPSSILVAQKFGDARIPNAQGQQVGAELQDCGIVYYPDHPYILCVMTKGGTIANLERVITTISQMAYQSVSARYPQK